MQFQCKLHSLVVFVLVFGMLQRMLVAAYYGFYTGNNNLIYLSMWFWCRMTFRRIIKKKSTEGFSAFPYTVALFNCILYLWYGSPFVSNGWENITVFIINAIGLVFETNFITIFYIFAQPDIRVRF